MKKRLMCLVLCLFTVLPLILTGCSKGNYNTGSTKLTTITMYMIIEDGTTEQGIAAVQDGINEITESKYYTHVELRCYPASEYEKVIDEKMVAAKQEILERQAEESLAKARAKELAKQGITTEAETTGEEETTGEIETIIDKDGKVRPKAPAAEENQLDIFLVTNQAKYVKYALPANEDEEEGMLYNMTEKVGDTFKLLNKYINPAFMNAVRVEGSIYGIPSNHMVSEYTYLLLNKEACTEQLSWTGTEFTNLSSLLDYCKAVKTYCPDFVPLYNLPDPDVINVTSEFSLLGNYYVEGATFADSKLPPKSLFANGNFTSHLKTCYKFKEAGYVEEGDKYTLPTDKKYAAAFLKGSVDIVEKYEEDYYVIPYSKPTATAGDMFSGVWCISSLSKNADVAMRIISMMSLDEDFRNLIQYGVEGETYTVDEDTGMIIPNTEGEKVWNVDPLKTGNQFLLKQSTTMSERELQVSADEWKIAKAHNQNVNLSLYGSFALNYITEATIEQRNKELEESGKLVDEDGNPIEPEPYGYMYTQDVLDGIAALTKDVMERVNNFEPYVDEDGNEITFEKFVNLLKTEVGSNAYMMEATDAKNADSIASQYNTWYETLYPAA